MKDVPAIRYRFTTFLGQSVLLIEELEAPDVPAAGERMDEIVEAIAFCAEINPVEHMIIFKDKKGRWDGYDFSTKMFRGYDAKTALGAMKQYTAN